MTSPIASQRHHRLIGLWLAVLALFALNLQGLTHYQRMLVEDAVCSVSPGLAGEGSSKTGAAHMGADCALSCAQAQAALPPVDPAITPAVSEVHRVASAERHIVASLRTWRAHQPRAPPVLA